MDELCNEQKSIKLTIIRVLQSFRNLPGDLCSASFIQLWKYPANYHYLNTRFHSHSVHPTYIYIYMVIYIYTYMVNCINWIWEHELELSIDHNCQEKFF